MSQKPTTSERIIDFVITMTVFSAASYLVHRNDADFPRRFYYGLITSAISALILALYRQQIKDWIKKLFNKKSDVS